MPKVDLCEKCPIECDKDESCAAIQKLYQIYDEQRTEEKRTLIKVLKDELNILDCEVSEELRELGEKITARFPEFDIIPAFDIKVGYAVSGKRKIKDGRLIYAECCKVKIPYNAWLPYDFVIVFYEPNVALMTDNQQKILMRHELKHIGIGDRGLCLVPHDIEDFDNILREYGLTWNEFGEDVPDILAN
jgi:hypothetical protein